MSNIDAYESCVLDSISFLRSHLDINILPIYNKGNIYSATIAANLALDLCDSEFLLYVHQDVRFTVETAQILHDVIKHSDREIAVIGTAGIKEYITPQLLGPWGINEIDHALSGKMWDQDYNIIWNGDDGLSYVQSVDEVAMLIRRSSGLKFDPTWPGYHLYGLDFCLQARAAAYKVASIPMCLQHCGQYSTSLYHDVNFLGRLIDMYGKWSLRFTNLCAPYCQWGNNRIVSYIPFALQDEFGQRIDVPRIAIKINDEYLLSQS